MKRMRRSTLAALILATVAAGKASATDWGGNGSWCGGSTFNTCFSVDLSWTAVAGNTLAVTLQLQNDDPTPGLKWFSIGMDQLFVQGSDPLKTLASWTVTGPTSDWGHPGSNDFKGGPYIDPEAFSTWNSAGGGELNPPTGSFRTWNFTLTMNLSLSAAEWDAMLQEAGVGIHAGGLTINGVNCSTKVIVRDNLAEGSAYGANGPDGSLPECESPSPPTEVTPEPATMSLMAIGLVGIVGAGVIRRRREV